MVSMGKLADKLAGLVSSNLSSVGIRSEYLWVAPANARAKLSSIIAAGDEGSLLIERR